MTTLLAEHHRKARKRHLCHECQGLILPGDTYLDQRCTDGSRLWTYRAHERCYAIVVAQVYDLEDWHSGISDIRDLLDGHTYECAGATRRDFAGCDCRPDGA